MADFTVIVVLDGITTVKDWLDPSSAGGAPSRLNSRPGLPQKRYVGARPTPVVLKAVVDGVVGPADATLGGRLFFPWTVEAPAMPFIGFSSPPGFSSVVTVVPDRAGHFVIGIRRPDGGFEHVHLDIN